MLFNGIPAAFTVDSDTKITAVVPTVTTSDLSGPIAVSNTGGPGVSSTNFTMPVPTVTSFSPASGGPGTVVTITGTNLKSVFGVDFNFFQDAGNFNVVSNSKITVTVPPGASTGTLLLKWPSPTWQYGWLASTGVFTVR